MFADPRIAAAILAAGTTEPHAVRELAARTCMASCERVAVVLGAAAGVISPALHGLPVRIETNVLWSEGVAASIRIAVAWALRSGCDGLLLVACDQYRVSAAHLERLLAAYRSSRADVVCSRNGHGAGLPAVFHGTLYARLGSLTGCHGAEVVVGTSPGATAVPWPDA